MSIHSSTVAILGGTFDPIHLGHIAPAIQAAKQLEIDQIRLMPCHIPPHKNAPNLSAQQRLAMIQLVCQQYEIFVADGRELKRNRPSYSVHTLAEMRAELGEQSICFMMGMDSFLSLPSWYEWQTLFDLCHIVVCQRRNYTLNLPKSLQALMNQRQTDQAALLHSLPCGKVFFAETDELDISSTNIRHAIKHQLAYRHWLTDSVADYIEQFQLYR